ncbi:glycosyl transferase [Biomphalaria glabrata]|uniref:Alpha-1,3-glucosyltransferase n=2 Tax=Biomphalaria glabrata TaxID=6526 RepID=A0A9W3B2Y7_BIOGL|nr:probable dolichyl pyrophosphate Glc1Man9GlcNAc2 alpha-1,3-glucosyltransferase isoform X2 [Biomphalaria glabrata]KAI8734070.1 putative dolichyl pyrophosphate Glc1Man9GlcNAc2 alpha-1; 3-glucosyltransferase [Biomphalaria glabrata]
MADIWLLFGAATFAKLLLIPSYRSTDFEVHRNWLAITHSLPLRQWYVDETSQWTLDYPPLFAWFEKLLSFFAQFFDPKMLEVSNLDYASEETVYFQRLSVIVTDFIFFYAVLEFKDVSSLSKDLKKKESIFMQYTIPVLLIFNLGLFIVDHIHFQYNGILFGIMLLSIIRILQDRNVEGAFWFAVLLNMKHIYMYVAPAYFIYLLRTYCFQADMPISWSRFSVRNFANLAAVVGSVFAVSFGPFIYLNQFGQVLSRLFPFKRGLLHAYWAPNFWALYSGVDKVLTIVGVKSGIMTADNVQSGSMTSGLVQEYNHTALPSIPPGFCFLLVIFGMLPVLLSLWDQRTKVSFVRSVVLCGLTSYLFGWHVHEKAILLAIIPLALLTLNSKQDARIYLFLSTVGYYSLFPLLFTPLENMLKVLALIQSSIFSFWAFSFIYSEKSRKDDTPILLQLPLLNLSESVFILGLIPLGLFNSLGFWLLNIGERLPFLPLLLTSVYCSLGIVYSWLEFYRLCLTDSEVGIFSIFQSVSRFSVVGYNNHNSDVDQIPSKKIKKAKRK